MFIDDENQARNDGRREGRAAFYITVTALAACVLMIVGLMNVAQAGSFDRAGLVLQGDIGETHLLLEVSVADGDRPAKAGTLLRTDVSGTAIDPTTTASTAKGGQAVSTIDQRLTAALVLAAFIAAAGISRLMSRSTHRPAPPAPWRSEA